ncbi:MAG: hypothetical protein N2248_07515 [candidate division WOR-3 bacterium]|uniref:Uncharacterized protein n=1 Tax=candidate division WOR-3 bacterium TaxID=2052148 RepID=A0A7C3F1W7_UNCW3|nr:hypothetical protein [candidate division WOR-3 bacterium]
MRQRLLVILGLAVAVLAIFTFTRSRPQVMPQVITDAATTEVTQTVRGKAGQLKSALQEAIAPPAQGETQSAVAEPIVWGSDPFVRDWMLMSEVANLNLRAITVTSSGASALINDQIVQVGDQISGKRVVSIEQDRVTLEQGGRTFTLTLGE